MPLVSEIVSQKPPKKLEDPIPEAHFVEEHWIHPKFRWADAAQELTRLFPRDARPERPRPWYRRLAGTHWPGQIPPGNGPFYIPVWALEDGKESDTVTATLKKAGFRRVTAHVVYLPQNSEYLAAAMRAAGKRPWTANPITARAYIYPKLRSTPDKKLRDYNVERWRI